MIRIERTTPAELEFVFSLFDRSVEYQEAHGYPAWKDYDKEALLNDIHGGNQYKVVCDSQPALVFSIRYTDKAIWREMECGDSLYIHRMVVNPSLKGRRLFGEVVKWARQHGRKRGLKFLRMDTWADNPTLIGYYKSFGFRFAGNFTTPDSPDLPVHNRRLALALLETDI